MDVTAIDNMTTLPKSATAARPASHGFAERLAAVKVDDRQAVPELDPDQAETLRHAAQQLVATTFIQPMLAKMREDPFKSEMFHGGRAEEIFGQQLDTVLSERIVAKADFSIVDAVYNSIARRVSGAGLPGGGVNTHA